MKSERNFPVERQSAVVEIPPKKSPDQQTTAAPLTTETTPEMKRPSQRAFPGKLFWSVATGTITQKHERLTKWPTQSTVPNKMTYQGHQTELTENQSYQWHPLPTETCWDNLRPDSSLPSRGLPHSSRLLAHLDEPPAKRPNMPDRQTGPRRLTERLVPVSSLRPCSQCSEPKYLVPAHAQSLETDVPPMLWMVFRATEVHPKQLPSHAWW